MQMIKKMIQHIAKWYTVVTVTVIFCICAIAYYNSIGELAGDADMSDAFRFLFTSPKEFGVCLICGAVAKAMFTVVFVAAVISIVWLIKAFVGDGYASGEIEIKDIVWYIINCVLAIVIGIVQTNIIVNWLLLVGALGVVFGIFYLWSNNSTSY